ncbi:nucleic acid-binding, OB-fold protein [Tanacetum coccineum]|uniref:Nucleic acid-binding, OB-fold protein n=1 Tax=Tanacetum coccineum TaxID=301880 RepID=A0ABQ4Y6F5_9ASTR
MAPVNAMDEPQLFLEQLELGVTGTIVLMFCRMWDVYAATGRYLSTDFVGSTMHATARNSIAYNFLKLKEDAAGGQSVRVTLWGSLGELLIEKRTNHVRVYAIVLTCLTVKQYNSRLYLSSTSSTLIHDDEEIPKIKQLKSDTSGAEFSKELLPVGCSNSKAGTLENLLMWSQNCTYVPLYCAYRQCRDQEWLEFSILQRRKMREKSYPFKRPLCESCNKNVDYLVLRYRLELEVSDDIAEVVLVVFNETASSLVKCTADSKVEYEDQLWPTLWAPATHWSSKVIHTMSTTRMKASLAEGLLLPKGCVKSQ